MLSLFFCFIASKVFLNVNDERQFVNWMRIHKTFYIGDEYNLRLGIFLTNLRYVRNFNKIHGRTYSLSMNRFSCYTPTEYNSLLGTTIPIEKIEAKPIKNREYIWPLQETYDWRENSSVNQIKDQGNCGAGWAFSAIASSETSYKISYGTLPLLSEQNLIDCVIFCFGCNSGSPQDALGYVRQVQGGYFNYESDYPYTGTKGNCVFDKNKPAGRFTEYAKVIEKDEEDLKERIAWHGVAAASISASGSDFMLYSGGVFDSSNCKESDKLDHSVAVVGYGIDNDVPYWIVRNSWGKSWGESGYIRMIRNKNNQCGIASRAIVSLAYDI